MPQIDYNAAASVGGKEVAKLIKMVLQAKAQGVIVAGLLKETTVDGASTTNIAIGGAQAEVFGVEAGQGGNYYNTLVQASVGIIPILNTISDDKLADLYMG